jgi:predicted RNase H-like HicB family nuclease
MATRQQFPTIPLTAIFVQDKNGGYSSFFAQFPEAMAQGHNEEEALNNLLDVFQVMLDDRKYEAEQKVISQGFKYIEKPFNLKLANEA